MPGSTGLESPWATSWGARLVPPSAGWRKWLTKISPKKVAGNLFSHPIQLRLKTVDEFVQAGIDHFIDAGVVEFGPQAAQVLLGRRAIGAIGAAGNFVQRFGGLDQAEVHRPGKMPVEHQKFRDLRRHDAAMPAAIHFQGAGRLSSAAH